MRSIKARKQPLRARNQRVSSSRQRRQQHLLDVKVRSHKATQHRNRRIMVFSSKVLLFAGISVGLYFGGRLAARRLFFENPEYRLSQIEIETDGTLQRDQILKATGLQEGENIFSVNLAHVQECLQQLPQVDEAQDLTQAFFAHLLEKQALLKAERERGRFRAFLLTALGLGLALVTPGVPQAAWRGISPSCWRAPQSASRRSADARSWPSAVNAYDIRGGRCW